MNKLVVFVAGAAIGSLVTWKLVKDKYERIANEEIASVKEVFSRRYAEKAKEAEEANDVSEDEEDHEPDPAEVNAYREMVKDLRYSSEEQVENNTEGGSTVFDGPYVITPDEFGEDPNYDTISLTLYADGILTDEDDEVITDVDDLVGEDSLTHFGEYEDDSVFVRDDRVKTDYEILRDLSNYSDRHTVASEQCDV